MRDITGDFEIHLTATPGSTGSLAAFAERHGLKFSDILLDRGRNPAQPMLTIRASGRLGKVHKAARKWHKKAHRVALITRLKIEAAPWNDGVPAGDEAAEAGRYFEHHVKLLLPEATRESLLAITALVEPHGARLSANARRHRDDGQHERFVTQRCHGVGRASAKAQLELVLAALREYEILEVEEEYVVVDTDLDLDEGWLRITPAPPSYAEQLAERENRARHAPAGAKDYPPTYQPLPADPTVHQRAAFDPSVAHYQFAYRAGEPTFDDPELTARWRSTRRCAIDHLLGLIAGSDWADKLVLRGSVALREWFGELAREPGDLDFVIRPHTIGFNSREGLRLLDDVIAAVAADPGPGLKAGQVSRDEIWTYERVPGRRLVFPYEQEGLTGSVQLDFVYNEELPLEPERLPIGDAWLLTAGPELSLAWKLLWLESDLHPQGKDLYDAVLLAERTDISPALVRAVVVPEIPGQEFGPRSVLEWPVDWQNFLDEYPGVEGNAESWKRRLVVALERSYSG
ncbi:nucleotidyl transferase AbiEii/AbiGii toxin family protein [Kribbella sp. NPDC051620]|uniref:nucleotidyl transferase AbiEii/AbiGii toxin family protein n=1 Tax=Kribbella sp. NPDC051620 TaxID=3364120 RepID=UPI0037BDD6C4